MNRILLSLVMLLGASSAHAFMFEPYVGYMSSQTESELQPAYGGTKSSDDGTSTAIGMRLGYKFLLPWVALDVTQYSGSAKDNGTSLNYKGTQASLDVGVDLPILFRFWAGYGFMNNFSQQSTTPGNPDTKAEGTFMKAGLGWKALPLMSINLEYIMNTYKKVDLGQGGGKEEVDKYFKTFQNNTTMLSLSIPL